MDVAASAARKHCSSVSVSTSRENPSSGRQKSTSTPSGGSFSLVMIFSAIARCCGLSMGGCGGLETGFFRFFMDLPLSSKHGWLVKNVSEQYTLFPVFCPVPVSEKQC